MAITAPSTTTSTAEHGSRPAVISVLETRGGTHEDARAIAMVWKRELIRFGRNRTRLITAPVQPILFLLVLGTGLGSVTSQIHGIKFTTFMFPGVVAMSVLFTAIFSSISIVWDREFGFMREMLVAPVHRSALVLGKCLGGATVATLQGLVMVALAGVVHVPYSPTLLLALVAEMAMLAFTLTAFGTMIAGRMNQVESFQVVMQLLVLPLFFLSGAIFPLRGLPRWLMVLTKIDPLSYAVDPMRRAVFDHLGAHAAAAAHALNPGMTWNAWYLPTGLELVIVAVLGVAALGGAMISFAKAE